VARVLLAVTANGDDIGSKNVGVRPWGYFLPTYFRHQIDTGLPRNMSYFRRSDGLPVPSVVTIDWHASMTGRVLKKFHRDDIERGPVLRMSLT
jgi:hypothetical protein